MQQESEDSSTIVVSETPRFEVGSAEALAYLEENGYVVLKEVATAEECKHALDLLWGFVHELNIGVRREDIATWAAFPASPKNGIIAGYGIGQSDFLWYARSLPKVKQAFAQIWGTDKLLTSFDGCGVFKPWQYHEEWKTTGNWFHVDQHPIKKPGKECIQGLISFLDANETTGNLVVLPKSHLQFNSLADVPDQGRGDYVRIPLDHPIRNHLKQHLVTCKAGDLILWDSRTIHCNSPALVRPHEPTQGVPWELLRVVTYVCMTPATKAKDLEDLRKRRKEATDKHFTTSHWPHEMAISSACPIPRQPKHLNAYQLALVNGD